MEELIIKYQKLLSEIVIQQKEAKTITKLNQLSTRKICLKMVINDLQMLKNKPK